MNVTTIQNIKFFETFWTDNMNSYKLVVGKIEIRIESSQMIKRIILIYVMIISSPSLIFIV